MGQHTIATVLVVDDEPAITDLYATWLDDHHDVQTAGGGEAALSAVDETVDVVLLDRRMPDLTGDEVLARIRDRGLDCRVVMVTAVHPDFDIVEMAFDDYVTKPVDRTALLESVEAVTVRDTYDEKLREYFALASKKAALEVEKTPGELRNSDRYRALNRSVRTLEAEAESLLSRFEDNFETLFRDFPGGSEDRGGPGTFE